MNQKKATLIVDDAATSNKLSDDLSPLTEVRVIDHKTVEHCIRKLIAVDCKFAIQTVTGLIFVRPSDVLLFRYMNSLNSWQLQLTDYRLYKLRNIVTAKDLLSFSQSFAQINQGCILNLEYLMYVENVTLKCTLCPPFADVSEVVSKFYYKKLRGILVVI